MSEIDLNEVTTFVRVVEAGGMSAAARQLDLPKSTVSRRLARLEERLGVRLLQRTTRRMGLTEAGQRYYERVGVAVSAIGEAAAELNEDASELRGVVRVTCLPDLGPPLLAALLDFQRRCPRVTVEVDLATRVVDLVAEGVDLGIRGGAILDGSLVARRLSTEVAVVAAAPEWVREHGAPERPEDLATRPCALFRPRNGVARWTLRRGEDVASVEVRGPLAGTDYGFVRLAALAGAGAALLPAYMAAYDVAQGRLVRLLPDWSTPGGSTHLVYPSARHLPARVRALRDHLVSWFTAPDWTATHDRCAQAMTPCPGAR